MSKVGEKRDTRRHERVRIRLDVSYGIHQPDRKAVADNISEAGLYLNTNDVFGVGTRLVLRIEFPHVSVWHSGEVVWACRVPDHLRDSMMCGMGIRFINPDSTWPAFFREWVKVRAGSE